MTAPAIKINGGAAGVKAACSAASAVTATLDSISGVRTVTWSIASTDETTAVANYTLVQSGSVGQNVATTSLAAGTAAILKVIINGGQDLQTGLADAAGTTATAKFYVATTGGLEVGAAGEKLESDATYGSTGIINAAVRSVAGSVVSAVTATRPIVSSGGTTPDLSWLPNANVAMATFGFTGCSSVANAGGALALSAGTGAASLTGSTTATVAASGGALLLTGSTTANVTATAGALTCTSGTSTTVDAGNGVVAWQKATVTARTDTFEPTGATTHAYVAGITSIAETWAVDASAAGGAWTREGQQGFAGQIGGSLGFLTGAGGVPGTQLGGTFYVDLRTPVTQATAKFELRGNVTPFFSAYLNANYCRIDNIGGLATTGVWINSTAALVLEAGSVASLFSLAGEVRMQPSTGATNFYKSSTLGAIFTHAADAAQSLAMQVRSGTGANDGSAFTFSAQAGQAQSGVNDNNDGASADFRSGAAGTGGSGAAGVDGTYYLRTGSTARVTLTGAGAHTHSLAAASGWRREYGTAATRYVDYTSATFTSDTGAGYETALSYTLPDNCVAVVIFWATGIDTTSGDAAAYGKRRTVKRFAAGAAATVGSERDIGADDEDDATWAVRTAVTGNTVYIEVEGDGTNAVKWGIDAEVHVTLTTA